MAASLRVGTYASPGAATAAARVTYDPAAGADNGGNRAGAGTFTTSGSWRPGSAFNDFSAQVAEGITRRRDAEDEQKKKRIASVNINAQGYNVRRARWQSDERLPSLDTDENAQRPTTSTSTTNSPPRRRPLASHKKSLPHPLRTTHPRHRTAHTASDILELPPRRVEVSLPPEGQPHLAFESFVVDLTAAAATDRLPSDDDAADAARNLYMARSAMHANELARSGTPNPPSPPQLSPDRVHDHPPRSASAPPPLEEMLTQDERDALMRVRTVLSVARDAATSAYDLTRPPASPSKSGGNARLSLASKKVFMSWRPESPSNVLVPPPSRLENDRTPATRSDAIALLHALKRKQVELGAPRQLADAHMRDALEACRIARAFSPEGQTELSQQGAAVRFEAVVRAWHGAEASMGSVHEELDMLEHCAAELERQVGVTCSERGKVAKVVIRRTMGVARDALGCLSNLALALEDGSEARDLTTQLLQDANLERDAAMKARENTLKRVKELEAELASVRGELADAREQIKQGASGFIKAEVMRAKAIMEGQVTAYEREMMRRNDADFKREMHIIKTEMRAALHNQTSAGSELFSIRDEIMANISDMRSDILEFSEGKIGKALRSRNSESLDEGSRVGRPRQMVDQHVQTMSEATFEAKAENPWAKATMPASKGGKKGKGKKGGRAAAGEIPSPTKTKAPPPARGCLAAKIAGEFKIPDRVVSLLPHVGADYTPSLRPPSFVADHLALLLRDYANYLQTDRERTPGMPLLPPYNAAEGLLRACDGISNNATDAQRRVVDALCSAHVGNFRNGEGDFDHDDAPACWLLHDVCCSDTMPASALTFWLNCEELFDSKDFVGTAIPPQPIPGRREEGTDKPWVHILRTQEAAAKLVASAPAASTHRLLEAIERIQVAGLTDIKGKEVPGVPRLRALGLLLDIWAEEQAHFKTRLMDSFRKADVDGDGQLDFDEFRGLVRSVEPSADDRRVISMFLQGIGEGNTLSPATFADVILKNGISCF